jgi:hypothetical protein
MLKYQWCYEMMHEWKVLNWFEVCCSWDLIMQRRMMKFHVDDSVEFWYKVIPIRGDWSCYVNKDFSDMKNRVDSIELDSLLWFIWMLRGSY